MHDYQRREDHPRLCGEKCHTLSRLFYTRGSPPPMRGKGLLNHVRSVNVRITPAYAGKSLFDFGSDRFNWDHPRLCGEKWGDYDPPRVFSGITPAYAGKRLPS